MRHWVIIVILVLAACADVPPAGPAFPTGAADTCQAAQYGWLVGQPDTALEKVPIMRQIRILRSGMAYTQEVVPARINFAIGPDSQITRIFCG